ncbi:hypothetical protein [Halalkalibacter nanhaiisediminis]|uniref:Uncharacterized protein n=1 Tax=Halalkalibacter nanhaiisediminis TaxID=688079 RepID=A0A562QQX8_9BACI|nr:hypothetical protein [Halalkalibacter nanhaiisediminis]TWI59158.1 hypothetical protein IQ10_00870 [Halalkalibacter nanhaiisediminis]
MYVRFLFIGIMLFLVLVACQQVSEDQITQSKEQSQSFQKGNIQNRTLQKEGRFAKQSLELDQEMEQDYQLTFNDFKERWNAVSKELACDLTIDTVEKVSNEKSIYYQAKLNKQIELQVFVSNNQVEKLILLSPITANTFDVLVGWRQIILMLIQESDSLDIDAIFHELGVEPNAEIELHEKKTVTYLGIEMNVSLTNETIVFEASYIN